ncbi:MAG: hypothetical protein COA54_02510 [Thiotrichaceae bacterium]|nr:MAG: hypothetical protein COA54_02510 [Thiotrichaceae bacterium]
MSDLATIRVAIKAVMESVVDIGVVHDRERYATKKSEFDTLFKSGDKLLGWFFFRERTAEMDGDTGEVRRVHYWQIYGFYSLSDAGGTALTFQDLVEDVAAAFRGDPTLGGVVDDNKNMDQTFGPVGIQVDGIENVMFAKTLCHRARLSLVTEATESK